MKKYLMVMVLMPLMLLADTWTDPATGIKWSYTLLGGSGSGIVSLGDVSNGQTAVPKTTSGVLVVPSQINGKNVVEVGVEAFYGCKALTSIRLPNVWGMGIKQSAFYGCSGLTSMTLPEVNHILAQAFYGCSGLKSLTIPQSVQYIEYNAFEGCSGLTSVTMPSCIEKLSKTFPAAYATIKEVTIPQGVSKIYDEAFSGCKGLTSVTIPEGVTQIGANAFKGCSGLVSVVIPSSVESVGEYAFFGCNGLKEVKISDLSAWCGIEFGAFANPLLFAHALLVNDKEIKNLEIPSAVTRIGAHAFSGCTSLISVTMPSMVSSVGLGAFSGCSGLRTVLISDLSAWCGIEFDSLESNPLYNARKLLIDGKEVSDLVIPQGLTRIEQYAFSGCDSIVSVVIPSSLTYIGEKAFYNCSSLTRMRLHWGIEVGANAIPATVLMIRPVTVMARGRGDEYVYSGRGEKFGAELVPDVRQYDVANVTNALPTTAANVGEYQLDLSAERFFNTNEAFEVAFVVDPDMQTSEVRIVPRTVEITARSSTKIYDGTPLTCDDVTFGMYGFVNEECDAGAVGAQTVVGVGKNVVVLNWAEGALESNYSIVTNEGTLTVLPAKVADAGAEPGVGTKPVGAISKFDGEAVTYDGEGHTINVAALEAVTLVADTPAFSYSLTSNGVYRSELYYFTNACVTSFWYKISAANYEDYVHEARVTILPREVTLTSGSASKNFDGTALHCERVEVTGDGFVEGEGVDVVYTGSQLWPGTSENAFTYSFKQGTLESNYDVTTANGTLTVGAAGRVVVDASVTVIPAEAFKNYTELTEVVLPDTVTEIGADAFAGCTKLAKVAFPSGMEVTREKLRRWGLSDAVLDDYVEGDFVIVNTSLLGYVGAADVAELVIPDGIELIDEYALSELYDLEWVELPETVRHIGKGAFANDTYLDEVVLPDSVEVIGAGAFENCSWMQTMTMGAGVRSVGDRAFAGCTKLAAAKFAGGLGEVGDAAFSNCWRMMSVSLPASVSNVAATAFTDCASLTGVMVPTMIAPMSEWFAPVYRQVENVTVPEGTTEVCAEMFAGCAALKTVELPEGVTNIASGAFRDCVALETILLPESLEAIGDEAFAGCAALKAIVLPKNVAILGKRVFSGCAALSNVTLSRALTAIPDGTFAGCDALDSFVVPESVTELGSQIVPSATTAIYYLGNAPAYVADVYAQANAALVSYVVDGTKGWDGRPTSRDIPQTWPTSNARTIRTWSPPPPSVTVRFNATGGTVEPEERVYVSEAPFGELPVPVRTHYDFAGWFTEASGGTQVTAASEVPLADRELFAHWTAKQYAIRFHANDGTEQTTDQAFTYGATVTLAKNGFVRTGYTFAGWAAAEDGGSTVYADGAEWKDVTAIQDGIIHLYALWVANSYEVRFDANGGEGTMEPQGFVYDEAKALRANEFVRDGYEFVEWNVSAPRREDASGTVGDGAVVSNMTTVAGGVVTLYAKWDEIAGPPPVEPPVEPPEEPIDPPEGPEQPEEPVVESVVTNTITYVGLEGAANTNVTEFTTNDLPLVLGPVEREGYKFLGWTPWGGVIPVGTASNVTFTALWEEIVEPPPVPPVNPDAPGVIADPAPTAEDVVPVKEEDVASALSYNGYLAKGDEIVGSVMVKVAKKGKVTATVQLPDGTGSKALKKFSYAGTLGADGSATLTCKKNDGTMSVAIGAKVLSGTVMQGGETYVINGRLGTKDALGAADSLLDKGVWSVALHTPTNGVPHALVNGYSVLAVTGAKKGKVKVAGFLADGTKVSVTAQGTVYDSCVIVPVNAALYKGKVGGFSLKLKIEGEKIEVGNVSDWTAVVDGRTVSVKWDAVHYSAKSDIGSGATFGLDAADIPFDDFVPAAEDGTSVLPDGVKVDSVGGKWSLPKAGKVAFAKDKKTLDVSKFGDNPAGLKLSYAAKTGAFKGAFSLYRQTAPGKLKKEKATVNGVVVKGVGYGSAVIKKTGAMPVTVGK